MNLIERCLKENDISLAALSRILGYDYSVIHRVYHKKQSISRYMIMSLYMFMQLPYQVKKKLIDRNK